MNQDTMFFSKTVEWETPQDFFDSLNTKYHFDLDVCATPENAKCRRYYTQEQDGLKQPWCGVCWCNPPYGRGIGKWVEKASYEATVGNTVVMLLPARTDTKWFHQYIYKKAEISFLAGRLKFGAAKNNAPFPCMVVVFKTEDKSC